LKSNHVSVVKTTKVKREPKIPNLVMLTKLLKNSFLLILYPAENKIAGNARSKNNSTLNWRTRASPSWVEMNFEIPHEASMPITRITPVSCPKLKCFVSIYEPMNMKIMSMIRKIT
jgi:hypothetical protein